MTGPGPRDPRAKRPTLQSLPSNGAFFFLGCSDALGVGGFANERSELATDLGCLHTTLVWCGWLRLWVWCAAVLCAPRPWCRVVPSGPRKQPPVCCGPARTGGWAGRPKVMLRTLVRSNSPARRGARTGWSLRDLGRATPAKHTVWSTTSLAAQQTRRAGEAGSAGPQFGRPPTWFSPGNLCASTRAHSFGSTCSPSHAPDYTSHPRECAKHAPPSLCSCTSVLAQAKPAVGPRVFVRQVARSATKLVGCSTSVPAPTRRLVWRVVVGAAQFY